jgi:ribosomal protein S12 methylthiotransferase
MVGFPGETEEDFANLVEFIKQVEFDHLGCFTYSKEEDTQAYKFKNQIDEEIKKQRKDIIMKEQSRISYRKNKAHIGEIMEGLITEKKNGNYKLRSYYNAIDDVDGGIIVNSNKDLVVGQKVKVKILSAFVYDLLGEVIE